MERKMTPTKKALDIYDKMDWFTNGYVGSSMLSNTEFDDVKIRNTKAAAMVVVDQVMESIPKYVSMEEYGRAMFDNPDIPFWQQVKTELESI